MSTCTEARAALASLDGVIRVHPFGLNGKCLVLSSNKEPLSQEKVQAALKGKTSLRVRKIERA